MNVTECAVLLCYRFAMEECVKEVLAPQQAQLAGRQQNALKRAQALVLLSRIYVGLSATTRTLHTT